MKMMGWDRYIDLLRNYSSKGLGKNQDGKTDCV